MRNAILFSGIVAIIIGWVNNVMAADRICEIPMQVSSGTPPVYPYYNNFDTVTVDVVAYRMYPEPLAVGSPSPIITDTKPFGYNQSLGLSDADFASMMSNLADFYGEFGVTINLIDTKYIGVRAFNFNYLNSVADSLSAIPGFVSMYLGGIAGTSQGGAFVTPSKKFIVHGTGLPTIVVHEMGHCLGLLHTWQPDYCIDYPGDENCESCGDQICDTPASPWNFGLFGPGAGDNFVDASACTLTTEFYDTYDIYPWAPSTTNRMSYSPIECRDEFTAEQKMRVFATLESDWDSMAGVVSSTTNKVAPIISRSAKYEAIVGGSATTYVVVVEASHPNGYDLRIHFEAIAFGDTFAVFLLDDGVAPDLVANDGLYTSAATALDLGGEVSYQIVVTAGAHFEDGGDHSFAEESVAVTPVSTGGFVNKSSSTGDLGAVPEMPTVSVLIDFDRDGDEDLLMGYGGSEGDVFAMNGLSATTPVFNDETDDRLVGSGELPAALTDIAAVDFDGDRGEDLLISATPPVLFRWNSAQGPLGGVFEVVTSEVLQFVPDHIFTAAWADMENDGWVDLAVVGRFDSAVAGLSIPLEDRIFFYRNVVGKLKYLGSAPLPGDEIDVSSGTNPFTLIWADMDQDSSVDLFISDSRVGSAGTLLYRNTGFVVGSADTISSGAGFADSTSLWFGASVPSSVTKARFLDADNDGTQELYIVGGASDELQIYRKDANKFELDTEDTYSGISVDQLALADFNLDGAIDALVTSTVGSETPKLLLNGEPYGLSLIIPIETGIPAGVASSAVGFDWSGGEPAVSLTKTPAGGTMSDFFYGYQQTAGASGPNKYIRLRVDPGGVVNSSGVGTRVEVAYDIGGETLRQYQWVTGEGSTGISNSKTLVFGLGEFTGSLVDVTIVWPNGDVSSTPNIDLTYGMPLVPNNFVHSLSNSTNLTVITDSESAVFQFGAGGNNQVIFEWDTDVFGEASVVVTAGSGSGCDCMTNLIPSAELLAGQTDVEVYYSQTVANKYHTKVVWSGRCCEPSCTYGYTVKSKLNGLTASATNTYKTLKNCPVSN